MSANDQLSFLAGLTGAADDTEMVEEGQDSTEMYADVEISANSPESEPEYSHFDPPEENLVFFTDSTEGTSEMGATDFSQFEKEKKLAKIVQSLQFSAPGEQMSTGPIGARRAARQKKVSEIPDSIFHDSEGRLVVNGQQFHFCDCLDMMCPGCHSNCPECSSRLCGPSCQKSRLEVIIKRESSTGEIVHNAYLKA